MAKASGFAVLLPKDRKDTFLECVEDGISFAEPVADFQHSRTAPLVCFIVDGGKLTHIGLGRRGTRAGTALRRLNIDQVEKLPEALSIRRLINKLPKRNAAPVKRRFKSGGLLTEKGLAAVVESIRQLSPNACALLDRFGQARAERIQRLTVKEKENLAQQKEAVLTALSIAGLDRMPARSNT